MDLLIEAVAEQKLQAILLALLHLAMAMAVTVHALLNKRDVRAAISWIGLAWLSPGFGPVLYLGLGINRVRRRARRLRGRRRGIRRLPRESARQDALSQVMRVAGRISGQPAEGGNRIKVLSQGDEGYPVMLAAIDGAEVSVALASYIFEADHAGEAFIEALTRAHERGVAVRVLIDGFGGGILRSSAYRSLARRGVPAARFLHSLLPWRMPLLNLRLHKKILVVDGRTAFVGGLNISADNLLAEKPRHPIRDTHFQVVGLAVPHIFEAFGEDWLFATGEVLKGPTWIREVESEGDATIRVISSGPDQDLEKLELVLLSAIALARQSIRIATPYFLPDDRLSSALQLAALRGVAVEIVVPEVGDHPVFDWACEADVPPLLNAGCRIRRAKPPFDHAKLMTVDDGWCLIGSANWDSRSLRLNFEISLEVYDTKLARHLNEIMDAKHGRLVTLADSDARPLAIKLRNAAARLLMPYL